MCVSFCHHQGFTTPPPRVFFSVREERERERDQDHSAEATPSAVEVGLKLGLPLWQSRHPAQVSYLAVFGLFVSERGEF